MDFAEIFQKNVITSKLNFFEFLTFFQPVLVVSYLQIQQKNLFSCRSFTKPFLCDIQCLKTIGSDRDLWPSKPRRDLKPSIETETRKNGLETPLLPWLHSRHLSVDYPVYSIEIIALGEGAFWFGWLLLQMWSTFDHCHFAAGSYDPNADDPDRCGSTSSVLWELHTMRRHYVPLVSKSAKGMLKEKCLWSCVVWKQINLSLLIVLLDDR